MDLDGKWVVVARNAMGDRFLQQHGGWTEDFAQASLFPSLHEALVQSDWSHHVVPAAVARSWGTVGAVGLGLEA
jgi:hypothetical protein